MNLKTNVVKAKYNMLIKQADDSGKNYEYTCCVAEAESLEAAKLMIPDGWEYDSLILQGASGNAGAKRKNARAK